MRTLQLLAFAFLFLAGCVHIENDQDDEPLVRIIKRSESSVLVGYEVPSTAEEFGDVKIELARIASGFCMEGYDLGRVVLAKGVETWTTSYLQSAGGTTCGFAPNGMPGLLGVTGMGGLPQNYNCQNTPARYGQQEEYREYMEYRRWIVCRDDEL
jgi:hypothetical protein